MPSHWTPALLAEITDIVFGPQGIKIQPCQVFFVFGGSHPGLWEKAAEAYFKGLGKDIVVTGGTKPGAKHHLDWKEGDTPEAHVIRRELIRLGIPEHLIYYEDRSTNTLENVLFAKEIYNFSKVKSILAVCKSYGVGRQCRTLEWNLAAGTQIIPYAFDTVLGGRAEPVITRKNWMDWEDSRQAMLEQAAKIYRYGKKGHLKPVEHFSEPLMEMIQP